MYMIQHLQHRHIAESWRIGVLVSVRDLPHTPTDVNDVVISLVVEINADPGDV
jgi:hypothetical protein